jgi:hypothetical protein
VGEGAAAGPNDAEVAKAVEHMREDGFSQAQIDAFLAKRPVRRRAEALLVHPANANAVKLLLAMASQWRVITLSTMSKAQVIRTGLEYGALEHTARLKGVEIAEGDFDRLQILEAECLKAWSEARP